MTQVAWYGAKVWLMTSPDGAERTIGTRPTHLWGWEMWTVTKDDGATVQVPQNVRPKYAGFPMSIAYDKEYVEGDDTTIPTVALIRVEYPDGTAAPIEAADYTTALTTQTKWNTAMKAYPTLKNRFPDQPYFPSV